MSKFDGLLNDTLPVLNFEFETEGENAGIPVPPNQGEGCELVGSQTQRDTKIHMTHVWFTADDEAHPWVGEHVHDYDEVLIWTGSDPENPRDLGAQLTMTIDGEARVITRSGSIYIPAGVKHCPLSVDRVTRPFTFSALSIAPDYSATPSGA